MSCLFGSSVGIVTGYELDGQGIESRWDEILRRPDRPWGPPSFLYKGYRVFPGGKVGRGVLLTTHPLLVPRSWKSKAIPLPTLWATTGPVTGTLYLFYELFIYVEVRYTADLFCKIWTENSDTLAWVVNVIYCTLLILLPVYICCTTASVV